MKKQGEGRRKNVSRSSKKRKIKKQSKLKIMLLSTVSILTLVLIVGGYLALKNGTFSYENEVGSSIDVYDLNFQDTDEKKFFKFPLTFVEEEILDVEFIGEDIFVLLKDAFICLSKTGELIFNESLNYSDAKIYTNSNFGIIYDEYSTKYKVFNATGILLDSKAESGTKILVAKVTESGNSLIVTDDSKNLSKLQCYDLNGEKVFDWNFANDFIVSLDYNNENEFVFGCVGSNEGKFTSKVYTLTINGEDIIKNSTEITDEVIIDVSFNSKENISVLTNIAQSTLIFDTLENINFINTFDSDLITYCKNNNGDIALANVKVDNQNASIISVCDKNNAVVFTTEIDEKIVDIYIDTKNVYALTSSNIKVLDSKGELKDEIPINDFEFGINGDGTDLYHYSVGVLHKNEYKLFTR